MAPSDIRTTTDKKFEHAKQIYAIAERWHDAIVVLQELCCAIGDRTSSRNSLLEKSSFVKKFVIPLMSDSIVNITACSELSKRWAISAGLSKRWAICAGLSQR